MLKLLRLREAPKRVGVVVGAPVALGEHFLEPGTVLLQENGRLTLEALKPTTGFLLKRCRSLLLEKLRTRAETLLPSAHLGPKTSQPLSRSEFRMRAETPTSMTDLSLMLNRTVPQDGTMVTEPHSLPGKGCRIQLLRVQVDEGAFAQIAQKDDWSFGKAQEDAKVDSRMHFLPGKTNWKRTCNIRYDAIVSSKSNASIYNLICTAML